MNRPWQVWIAFGLSMLVAVGAMAWLTWKTVELEQGREEAIGNADLDESIRLALWRLDSALTLIVGRENARPHFVYESFFPAEYGRNSRSKGKVETFPPEPSPLLTEDVPHVLLHFQMDETGTVSSPRVPSGKQVALAEGVVNGLRVESDTERLLSLEGLLASNDIEERLSEDDHLPGPPWPLLAGGQLDVQTLEHNDFEWSTTSQEMQSLSQVEEELSQQEADPSAQQADPPQQAPSQTRQAGAQQYNAGQQGYAMQQRAQPAARQTEEYQRRQMVLNEDEYNIRMANNVSVAQEAFQGKQLFTPDTLTEGLLHPLWIGDELILARRVSVNGRKLIQGCWLDWPGLKADLLSRISYLLPRADLVKAEPGEESAGYRKLVALPVRIKPGSSPEDFPRPGSPLKMSLVLTWTCVSLAALAVAALLKGTLSLSERRASFVSAVTHELRTPLTTFRMYTEMLTGGMVPDEERKHSYLLTLGREARRLSHLVENVLAYARLEKNRSQDRLEKVELEELLERSKERLEERTTQVNMDLRITGNENDLHRPVLADPGALEQILFNLVDNACKYGSTGSEKSICVAVQANGDTLEISVSDQGPGISPDMRRRLFRPFSKSAHEAARSAPGVGLGLALSRRLAREMGGDLRLDGGTSDGACFVLSLRRAP